MLSIIVISLISFSNAFVPERIPPSFLFPAQHQNDHYRGLTMASEDWTETLSESLKTRYRIAQEAQQQGSGFKQIMASVIAGEYDAEAINNEIDAAIASAPLVLFTWQASPSCKQAIRALDLISAQYKIVRLDDPWDQGNKIRAELGKRQNGKCSVPSIYLNGEYIGGYDSGIDEERPGLVDLAFKGKLLPLLRDAGALGSSTASVPAESKGIEEQVVASE